MSALWSGRLQRRPTPYSVRVNVKNPAEPFESEQDAIDFTTRMTAKLHQGVDGDAAR